MLTKVKMPEVSITTAEVTLITWLIKPGERVTRGMSMFTVETDKATMDVEAYVDGYLRQTYFKDGETVPLDAVVALISTTPDEPLTEEQVGETMREDMPDQVKPEAVLQTEKADIATTSDRIIASPVAKQLAQEHHLELATIKGSGPGGRITRDDVEAAIQQRQISIVSPAEKPTTVVSANMRKAIAQRTMTSKATIPHYYVSIDIDMSAVLTYLGAEKQKTEAVKSPMPTVTDVIIWACGQVIPSYRMVNASWSDGDITFHPQVNIGMVVGVENGLMVPVVYDADTLSIAQIARTTASLKQKAMQGTLTMAELGRSTFTISNLGMFGVSSFIAVINPPESAILALASIQKKMVVADDEHLVIKPMMTATLSADHRIVDGIAAAKFLNTLAQTLTHLK